MEQLLREIIEGQKAYRLNNARPYKDQVSRGKGTKLYLTKKNRLIKRTTLKYKKGIIRYGL